MLVAVVQICKLFLLAGLETAAAVFGRCVTILPSVSASSCFRLGGVTGNL